MVDCDQTLLGITNTKTNNSNFTEDFITINFYIKFENEVLHHQVPTINEAIKIRCPQLILTRKLIIFSELLKIYHSKFQNTTYGLLFHNQKKYYRSLK